jgi:S-adenosylmethionine:tRNA ribosyltransferase-isomerase
MPPRHPASTLTVDDFDYELPGELIAQRPVPERSASRLLRLARHGVSDHAFGELPELLAPGDLLVVNDTRVVKARLFGVKDTGGRVEVLIERVLEPNEALAQVRASHPPHPRGRLRLAGAVDASVIGRDGDLFRLRFAGDATVLEILERHGAVPLPPYITHPPAAEDEARYQTVYAHAPGAVAAPTAGLHFDTPLLEQIRARRIELAYLTLHIGAGTFQPVRTRDITAHRMHAECYDIPPATAAAVRRARERGHHVVAVGTTSLRALEAAACGGGVVAGSGETDLFVTPGYRFKVVDRLITNFHLPKSTLLMLVSAFAGIEPVRAAYRHAIAGRYRFFSYGDATLIDRQET